MNCPYCGEHNAICECDSDDGTETMTDLQAHNKGLCNSLSCIFCEEEVEE